MDSSSFESLRGFFERIKNAGFFERLFFWKRIVAAGYDAYTEYQRMQALLAEREREVAALAAKSQGLSADCTRKDEAVARAQQQYAEEHLRMQAAGEKVVEMERERATLSATLAETQANSEATVLHLREEIAVLKVKNEELVRKNSERENEAGGLLAEDRKNREQVQKLNADLAALSARYDQLGIRYSEAVQNLAKLRQNDEERTRVHDARVTELVTLKNQLEEDRRHMQVERAEEIHREYEEMAQTWKRHEEDVEAALKAICQRHTIMYCDREQFPYTGKPDNALMICDQYVIFDAKSPKDPSDLDNFPQYIRSQAEAVKKYVKAENVKKDVFLVVPANTVAYLSEFHYDMADWEVYVVTRDCLEPVVLALRKIEDYEFAEQLSPEDRENVCRVIGKFAHAAKRRVQIDNYFCSEFIEILQSCDHLLPGEIRQKVVEFEMAEKMNPPIEKRKKKIPIRDLEHEVKVIGKEAEAREIDVTAVTKEKIENMPLHKFLE